MIISKIQGGLGNQLFQWAYGLHSSKVYSTDLYLDIQIYKSASLSLTPRKFSLGQFPNLKFNLIEGRVDAKTLTDSFNFNHISYNSKSNYYLDGYWQSEKYFRESSDIILHHLDPLDHRIISKYGGQRGSVSIHVRRTDYLTSNGFHPVQDLEYYEKSLNLIGEYERILVFSDDIEWCKANIRFKNCIFIENLPDVESLWLMSMCENNIIANSSFSWWGAWLNKNPQKKVIAPRNWFGQQTIINVGDIIPKNWITI